MSAEDPTVSAMKMAAAAAGAGAAARIALALHGGTRGVRLAIEGFVGAMLGIIASGFALWWDADLRDAGWPLLMVSAFAGLAGALGTRALDILEVAIKKRFGG
jgi:hypothetical protein